MLEIKTLGGLAVTLDGVPVTGFASRKVLALLVYLASAPGPRSRESLAELLWEEQGQEQALGNLRVALASLKSRVGPHLVITRHALGWSDAPCCFDARELAVWSAAERGARERGRCLSQEAARRLEAALRAYEGTVVAVTHDRWFARSFDRFVLFQGDGEVVETPEPVWDSA